MYDTEEDGEKEEEKEEEEKEEEKEGQEEEEQTLVWAPHEGQVKNLLINYSPRFGANSPSASVSLFPSAAASPPPLPPSSVSFPLIFILPFPPHPLLSSSSPLSSSSFHPLQCGYSPLLPPILL